MGFFERLGVIMDSVAVYVVRVHFSVFKLVYTVYEKLVYAVSEPTGCDELELKSYMTYSKPTKYAKVYSSERCTNVCPNYNNFVHKKYKKPGVWFEY
jgi:hypothetical protein